MIKKSVKSYIFECARIPGVYSILKNKKRGATVLFYHGVENTIINPVVQEFHFPFSMFEKQMQYLQKNFEIVSLDYLYDCISNNYKIDSSQVLITFDDGYKNNINVVLPFMKSHNIPFSVFITTGNINNGSRFPTYYLRTAIYYTENKHVTIPSIKKNFDISTKEKRLSVMNTISKILKKAPQKKVNDIVDDLIALIPHDRWSELNDLFSSDEPMNWDEVRTMHDEGVIIGSHCHDHAILHSNQSNDETDYQLKTSKKLIEKHIGDCRYFAFPNGSENCISRHSVKSVEENKYFMGFSIVRGEIEGNLNPFILPRNGVPMDISHSLFVFNTGFRFNSDYLKWCSKYCG